MTGRGLSSKSVLTLTAAAMYASFSFEPDRQPRRASADATGDAATRAPYRAHRADAPFHPAMDAAAPRQAAVAQADGEP